MEADQIDIYSFLVAGTLILLLLFCFIVVFLFLYKNRQQKHRYELRAMEDRYGKEILLAQLEIREQTLKYISEELHDNLGQVLSLVALHLSTLELEVSPAGIPKVGLIADLVHKAVADLRNLSRSLDADKIGQEGLVEVIRFELDILGKSGRYQVAFRIQGEQRRMDPAREIVLFRIVQEVLNNFIKHARATVLEVSVVFSEQDLTLILADNGVGFDPGAVGTGGAGLSNMRHRAALIGAGLRVSSAPGQGTRTTINLTI